MLIQFQIVNRMICEIEAFTNFIQKYAVDSFYDLFSLYNLLIPQNRENKNMVKKFFNMVLITENSEFKASMKYQKCKNCEN